MTSGLAMGLGLDRLLMLRKRLPDIRLLRAGDPRIAGQMRDLERTLTHEEANQLRAAIYAALHRGAVHQWAAT